MFGSASYSAMIAMVGPAPRPAMVARNAVGSPPTPRSTAAPCRSRNSVSQPAALCSLKHSSGLRVDLMADPLELVGERGPPPRRRGSLASRRARRSPGGHRGRLSSVRLRPHRRANSALAASTGRDRRADRRCVRAMVLAAATMPARASGLTAASAKSRVWMAMPVGAMADHRLDRRQHLAHVADVGGAQPVRDRLALDEPGRRHVGGEEVEQHVGSTSSARRRIVVLGRPSSVAPVASGRALGAGDHAPVELPHRVDPRRAHVEDRRRRTRG